MLIKPADDRSHDIQELQRLQAFADGATARRIEQEIRQIKAGIRGEEEAAYEMQVRWGHRPGWAVLHDLRIEHDGLVAQIDHLMINRLLDFWICESKHFAEGVAINEHGEFTAFFGSKPYGVPSPIQQNEKHLAILKRFLASGAVTLPSRLGFTIKPALSSLVLVSKGARISRPKAKVPGLESVIKVDQLFEAIGKANDDANPLLIAKVVSEQTVQDLARQIASHHRPAHFNWAARFGLLDRTVQSPPDARTAAPTGTAVQPVQRQMAVPASVPATARTPAPAQTRPQAPMRPVEAASASTALQDASAKPGKEYRCHACATVVELKVARFCWFNKPKFNGNVYCMSCQKDVAS